MSSDDAAIEVDSLSKCYHIYDQPRDRLLQMLSRGRKQYYRRFWALRDVSFRVRRGETIGIVGRNGSGKSTLLQMISGTLNPTGGVVQVNGRIAALLELGAGFNPEFTGRENTYMNGAVLGLSETEINARFCEIESFAEIGEFIDQPVKTYSSGMIVRLAFAVSVCVEPDILIVDEALAVGDAAFQFKCLERLKRLSQSGTTLLFVSHDISMVKSFCGRAIYLESGMVKADGAAEVIAELYAMDLRKEQQKQLHSIVAPVIKKSHLRDGLVAFGTTQGAITGAAFGETGLVEADFYGGETIRICVDYEYSTELADTYITLVIQNQKMVELGGKSFLISAYEEHAFARKGRLVCEMPMVFGSGTYYVTVKLEARNEDAELFPIDKQAGVLMFNVDRVSQDFLSPVDLNICLSGECKP